jgi:NDP-sugar pyrophosphorylase family protein
MPVTASYPCPLSRNRKIEDFPIGNMLLSLHQQLSLGDSGIHFHPHAWLDIGEIEGLDGVLIDESNMPIAWAGELGEARSTRAATKSFIIRNPWDFLRANEAYVASLQDSLVEGFVHSLAVIEGNVRIGTGTRILPGVFIEGNVIIGENCKIGPNCYLRGNTSIGDNCHIGQSVEVKNCLILSETNIGHLSYVGDSVLGHKVNFGAGTTTSNLRHDGKNHQSMVEGKLVDTGRRKFGTIVADGVHTGINTSIYPGRKFWPNTSTRPGEIVQKDIQISI